MSLDQISMDDTVDDRGGTTDGVVMLPINTDGGGEKVFTIDDVGFFEGTEKLLEVWFTLSDDYLNTSRGLREIPRKDWNWLLGYAQCKVLSETSNGKMDAYVLSESSMFVSDARFILKTCGTTTLMKAVKPLLSLVETYLPGTAVSDVFYSHQNFKKPDLQIEPHRTFTEECAYLDSVFKDGSAYVLGNVDHDCWYLYIIEHDPQEPLFSDQTLEVIMTELDPKVLGYFSKDMFETSQALDKAFGIDTLIPGALIDSHLFDPCGYSVNGIIKDDFYFTIHVTPQDGCAYVSFETNYSAPSYTSLVMKILVIFKPRKFNVTVFANDAAECGVSCGAVGEQSLAGYKCIDRQCSTFSHYNLTYWQFSHT